eukprot:scaffold2359_cov188-Prasinococcus_capsulatus_cf.AAC.1
MAQHQKSQGLFPPPPLPCHGQRHGGRGHKLEGVRSQSRGFHPMTQWAEIPRVPSYPREAPGDPDTLSVPAD